MSEREVFVVGATRTAIGGFGGSLKDVPLSSLATTVVRAALERAGTASPYDLDLDTLEARLNKACANGAASVALVNGGAWARIP